MSRSLFAAILSVLVLGTAIDDVRAAPAFLPRNLFSAPAIRKVLVSPSGEWIAALARSENRFGIIVQRRGRGKTAPVYLSEAQIYEVDWIGENTLFVRHSYAQGVHRKVVILRLAYENGMIVADELVITARGHLVDPLPDEDEVVLWGSSGSKYSQVLRGPISGLAPRVRWKNSGQVAGGQLKSVVRIRERVWRFLADRRGVPRAAEIWSGQRKPVRILKYRRSKNDRWREVWRARDDEEVFTPFGIAEDDRHLIVATRGERDTIGLYEFDPETGELGRTILALPNVDIVGVVFDYDRKQIIAAVYQEGGSQKFHYFHDFSVRHLEGLTGLPEGDAIHVTSTSRDYRFFALLAHGARNPGEFFFFDKQTGRKTKLGDVLPGIPRDRLVDIDVIDVVAADGTKLEAFLARPESKNGELPPLVVVPHGGPIAVRDDRSFDPLLQYLALDGIAVLKVNYRGSSGYGKAFQEAGKSEYGGAIEEDIDAAVREVLRRGLVDSKRICIAGGSYGGLSALLSAIRYPDLYRCAATFNGVTDVPLTFQSSDYAGTKEGRERKAEWVGGDPESDYEQLVEISPVYRVAELSVPVLIVHGSEDVRVPPDHAYRLRAMLEVHGKPYDWLELKGAGHSPNYREYLNYAAKLRSFLRTYLPSDPSPDSRYGR